MEQQERNVKKEIALDSEDFDPKEALFGGDQVTVKLPVPRAKVFNNIAEYYSRTFGKRTGKQPNSLRSRGVDKRPPAVPGRRPPTAPDKREPATQSSSSSASTSAVQPEPRQHEPRQHESRDESTSRERTYDRRSQSRRPGASVIDKMHQAKGPLCILYKSMNTPIKILVRRRKACALREERFSWITGTLLAFDKHLNLALSDVIEEFRYKTAAVPQGILIRKHTKNILVRGDNIVLVANTGGTT